MPFLAKDKLANIGHWIHQDKQRKKKPKQQSTMQQPSWVWWVQSATVTVVWIQLLLAQSDTEIKAITTFSSRIDENVVIAVDFECSN